MRQVFLQKAAEVPLWSSRPELWANEVALLRAGAESPSAWAVAGASRLHDPWVWLYGLRTHFPDIDLYARQSGPSELPAIAERLTRSHVKYLIDLAADRDVQTNEPRRARYVRLIKQHLGLGDERPYMSIELGASAGLVSHQGTLRGGLALGIDRRPLDMFDPLHGSYLIAHTQPGSSARRRLQSAIRSALASPHVALVTKGSTYEDVEVLQQGARGRLTSDVDHPLLVFQCRIGEVVDPEGLAAFLQADDSRHVVLIEASGDLRSLNHEHVDRIDRSTDGNAAVAVSVSRDGSTHVLAAGDIDARRVVQSSRIDFAGDLGAQLLGSSFDGGMAR